MCRTPFFFSAPEGNDYGMRIAEDAVYGRQGVEAGKSINVAELPYFCHDPIIARFQGENSPFLPGHNRASATFIGIIYPLQDAKILN
jgi:hypothetical protein